ncbi:3687_t:CDS:2 [Acaulospora morrowiae]|uniref:3687_t:CDS:1 n=1 Tax=Acaulospora morrowiae TaxID=94023 RepID=A0A9N8ZW50_9GLOM|nr:3687_t:CDS:2 [Acaulospora morrowiae]
MANLLRTSLLKSLLKSSSLAQTRKVRSASLIQQVPVRINTLPSGIRGFSATRFRSLPAASIDRELASKLTDELKYEKENETSVQTPDFIKNFLSQNSFKIEDKPGANEVALTRTFGNERIRLLFDINTSEQSDQSSFAGDEEDEEDGAGKGALGFESLVADGVFLINYVSYYHDAKLAGDWTAEADWKRRGYYPGPQFETLDNDVQVLFEKYLEERGINTAVALFIPNYVEYKEQKEYVSWLENVKKFIASP